MSTNNSEKEKQINDLIKNVSRRLGESPDKLKSALKSRNLNEIIKGLNPKESEKIKKALDDKDTASRLLSSPQAQKLLKNLMGDK